ncbi:MAG: hypothetical protein LBG62_01050 [Candidatus Methanoplasma sp.]|jgi:hypothetical protein|nr:hypothetical protein [Candidatus Methanoplasma sp.]
MALNIFKSGDELFNQGVDLVKRKEYAKARKNFEKTIEKGGRESALAKVYVGIIDAISSPNSGASYDRLAGVLRSCGIDSFEFGLTDAETAKLITECELISERISALALDGDLDVKTNKGNRLLELAQKYQVQIGNSPLKMYEIMKGDTVTTGLREALGLQAIGYETLASATVFFDPKKAAEQLQSAYSCRKQLGDGQGGDRDMGLMKAYSRSVKCWICGRQSTGEGIHFLAMSSDITPFMRTAGDDLLKSAPETYESVYVCRPCYTSISRRSDEIARGYHERAMAEMRAMEARLQAEIASVRGMALMRR